MSRNDLGTELFARSTRFIDQGSSDGPASTNPVGAGLAEVGDGIALITAFSHVVAISGSEGLTLVDTSLARHADSVLGHLRRWSDDPVKWIVYTHGHVDHVGGARRFVDEAYERNRPLPQVVAHSAVEERFKRYDDTDGYNGLINSRQFRRTPGLVPSGTWAPDWVWPHVTFTDRLHIDLGGEVAALHHAKGETDDHLWMWIPSRKTICGGDFLTWVFPNAGNPQKVQRFPLEWAKALREMAALEPEIFLPAHGLPIEGKERIGRVLGEIASALESLVGQTLQMMNAGATFDEVLHTVKIPAELADRPYLQATYDEPEFVVHNIWRLYGGWWDGDPAQLKPSPKAELAREIARLAGGADRLAKRAIQLSGDDQLRLACHLAELAAQAEPSDPEIHAARSEVYAKRRSTESSLMAKSIFAEASEKSAALSRTDGQ